MSKSPFSPSGVKPSDRVFDEELVKYKLVDSIVEPESFDPSKPDVFLTETKTVEYERTPIVDYVQSFVCKVGLKNELKGIISKQQMDEYIEEHKASGGFVDLTKLPDTAFEMEKLAQDVDKYWSEIPDELKGDLTKEEFIKQINSSKILEFVNKKVAESQEDDSSKKEGE